MIARNKAQWATVWIACLLTLACSGCSRKTRQATYLEAGKRLLANKDYGRAVLECKNAVKMDPGTTDRHYQLGLAYLAMGDASSALTQFLKAGELDANHIP